LAEAHTLDSGHHKCFVALELAVKRFHTVPLDANRVALDRFMCCSHVENAKEYQAKRYLNSAQLKKLGNGLRLVLQDGDAHVGSVCPDSGAACKGR
jgi:hypothetical protein